MMTTPTFAPHSIRHILALVMLSSALSCEYIAAAEQPNDNPIKTEENPRPSADHHLHIRSSKGAWVLGQTGDSQDTPGDIAKQAITASEAIAALDAAGIHKGLVLSTAYMFGSPDLKIDNEYSLVRAENDYVANQIAEYPDRLIGACSVNPLKQYAQKEIRRCSDISNMHALKLHLGNSQINLGNVQHIEQLLQIFQLAEKLQMSVIIHLRTFDDDYGADKANIFINNVLSAVPELPVQVAHMTGWGGYDHATDAALSAFADAIQNKKISCKQITFDLGAVVFSPEAAGDNTELAQQVRDTNEQLSARIREIGPKCFVYATDWPSWPPARNLKESINANVQLMIEQLNLDNEQLKVIFSNQASLFKY